MYVEYLSQLQELFYIFKNESGLNEWTVARAQTHASSLRTSVRGPGPPEQHRLERFARAMHQLDGSGTACHATNT